MGLAERVIFFAAVLLGAAALPGTSVAQEAVPVAPTVIRTDTLAGNAPLVISTGAAAHNGRTICIDVTGEMTRKGQDETKRVAQVIQSAWRKAKFNAQDGVTSDIFCSWRYVASVTLKSAELTLASAAGNVGINVAKEAMDEKFGQLKGPMGWVARGGRNTFEDKLTKEFASTVEPKESVEVAYRLVSVADGREVYVSETQSTVASKAREDILARAIGAAVTQAAAKLQAR